MESKQYKQSLNNLTNKIGDKDVSTCRCFTLVDSAEESLGEYQVCQR